LKGRAAVVLLAFAACGKPGPTPASLSTETPEYLAWKGSQALRSLPAASFAESLPVTVTVHYPQARSRGEADFVELFVNGQGVQRLRAKPPGSGPVVPLTLTVTILAGPGWLDLWDSTQNTNYRFTIDTRQGKDYVFSPTPAGYDLTWSPREN
jgi:hypothetical protein